MKKFLFILAFLCINAFSQDIYQDITDMRRSDGELKLLLNSSVDPKNIWDRAEQGDYVAQAALGIVFQASTEKDYKTAISWFKKSAEQGFGVAQEYLAYMYAGGIGVPKDFNQGFYWMQKAAEQGRVGAQHSLGRIYFYGDESIPKDCRKAIYWYQKAADQGHKKAQLALGDAYYNGDCVAKDKALSMYWYTEVQSNADMASSAKAKKAIESLSW